MERTELTLLTSKAKYISYEQLTEPNYLASICKQEFKNYFEFVRMVKNQHGKTLTDVTPIKLTSFDTKYLPKVTTVKTSNPISIKTIKTTIKTLFMETLSNDYETKEQYKNLMTMSEINKLLSKYGLQEYYDNKTRIWHDEFERKNHIKIKNQKELQQLISEIM